MQQVTINYEISRNNLFFSVSPSNKDCSVCGILGCEIEISLRILKKQFAHAL
jgi:hypothetical protein